MVNNYVKRPVQQATTYCRKRFGFEVDMGKSVWQNVKQLWQQRGFADLPQRPQNLQCHILGKAKEFISDLDADLLGLGLNYCVNTERKAPTGSFDTDRLLRDIRVKHMFAGSPLGPMPKLYQPNPEFEPDEMPSVVENDLKEFRQHINTTQAQQPASIRPNLSKEERRRLLELRNDENIVILPSDKNLGIAVVDTVTYIHRGLHDHLLNTTNYKQLTAAEAEQHLETVYSKIKNIISRILNSLGDDDDEYNEERKAMDNYFTRSYFATAEQMTASGRPEQKGHGTFYMMPKVHKNPWQTRPVGSQSGSLLEPLAKWVDAELQQVVHLCPSYFKDSGELQKSLEAIDPLPPEAVIFSADAKAMYCNIDTDHGLWVLRQWFKLHKHELPDSLAPTDIILDALELIMRNNSFTFGDTWWLQISGTAMGTSPAPAYATIYYSYHEETAILPKKGLFAIRIYKRFIDDAYILQIGDGTKFKTFMDVMNNFGQPGKRLEWEPTPPSRSVDFLDLTIFIQDNGKLAMRTYQKPMNLYLYLPPTSAHPPAIYKGFIYGMLYRYWQQNTLPEDYRNMVGLLFDRLMQRGHHRDQLEKWFLHAAQKIDAPTHTTVQDPTTRERVYLHVKYHPGTLPRQTVHNVFNQCCRQSITNTTNGEGFRIGNFQLVIAYSRRENIRDLTVRSKLLTQSTDLKVSTHITRAAHSGQSGGVD